jgi:hypothetical protein
VVVLDLKIDSEKKLQENNKFNGNDKKSAEKSTERESGKYL